MVDWANLSLFVGSVSAAVAGLIVATQKSKCSHIECCCIKCDRNIPNVVECNDLESQLENVVDNDKTNTTNTTTNTTARDKPIANSQRTFTGGLPLRPNVS